MTRIGIANRFCVSTMPESILTTFWMFCSTVCPLSLRCLISLSRSCWILLFCSRSLSASNSSWKVRCGFFVICVMFFEYSAIFEIRSEQFSSSR